MSAPFLESTEVKQDIQDVLAGVSVEVENSHDLDSLIEEMGNAKIVLLGEASHGTHEYYTWRTQITKRLMQEKGFNFIGVEGDWPDCYKINRFVKGYENAEKEGQDVVKNFERWPTWMWANWEVVAFIEWLKNHNKELSSHKRKGFYGLDVYSLWQSLDAIINYLEKNDPGGLEKAKAAFRCFEPYRKGEGQAYASATRMVDENCQEEVVDLLADIRRKATQYNTDPEASLNTEQNATVAVNAEKYYRAMVSSSAQSWNVRDRHMAQTLDRLLDYHGPGAKAVIWAHNTHIGDARYTDMHSENMVNIGQLVREKYGLDKCHLHGFGSYSGSVIAGRRWGAPMEEMQMPKAAEDSWEQLLFGMDKENQILFLNRINNFEPLKKEIDHRAIGVVYHPDRESFGNYVPSILPDRYDTFQFLKLTTALHPLHITPESKELPQTYPWNY
ncbi:MAG: erythromycin esterase family protein [Balneolaceae bacterium]